MFKDTISGMFFPNLMPLGMSFAEEGAGGGGEGNAEFEGTAIPESYKESPIGKYATIGDLAKGYGEAQKLIGAKGAIIPGDKATDEDYGKFYNSIGRPEKAEGYKFDPIDNAHAKIRGNTELEKNFKDMADKHGLSQRQASAMYKDYVNGASVGFTKMDEKSTAAKHETETALRTEWGADYDTNLKSAQRLIEKFGGTDGREAFGELGNSPAVLKTIANISKKFSEDGFIKGDQVNKSEQKDAQQKITDILLDKAHPYWVKGPGHAEAVEEYARLQKIVTPEVA